MKNYEHLPSQYFQRGEDQLPHSHHHPWEELVQVRVILDIDIFWKFQHHENNELFFLENRFRDIFDDYVIGMKEAVEAEEGAKDK